MIPELDAIKARAKRAQEVSLITSVSTASHIHQRRSAADVPRLVAALEAVLALGRVGTPYPTAFEKGYDFAIEDIREAVERALKEGQCTTN